MTPTETAHGGLQVPHTSREPLCPLPPDSPRHRVGCWSRDFHETGFLGLAKKKVVAALEPQLSDLKLGSFFLT